MSKIDVESYNSVLSLVLQVYLKAVDIVVIMGAAKTEKKKYSNTIFHRFLHQQIDILKGTSSIIAQKPNNRCQNQ